jgi:pimeloyl-ACP methyl ester carboxylesterase
VVVISGLGDSLVSRAAVLRHVSGSARIYVYDRTGLGRSELPSSFAPESKSYVNIAKELRLPLDAARIPPPYLLVMHSMGGLPGREFLNLYSDEVAGMVFLDTVTVENYKTRPAELPRMMRVLSEGVDRSFLWTERSASMTKEEWAAVLDSEGLGDAPLSEEIQARQGKAAEFEAVNLVPSSDALAERKQFEATPLGDRPVSVVKVTRPESIEESSKGLSPQERARRSRESRSVIIWMLQRRSSCVCSCNLGS